MFLVKKIEQYDENNLFFCEPIKNNIIKNNSIFSRILYSTDLFTSNGICLFIYFNEVDFEKYYSKYKCIFNVQTNKNIIDNIKTIEENILKKYETTKIPVFKIYEHIKNGNIYLYLNVNNLKTTFSFILKISGIWETQTSYGLTYKFISV
jgi:hypothetical protein